MYITYLVIWFGNTMGFSFLFDPIKFSINLFTEILTLTATMRRSLAAPPCQSGVECCVNVMSACAPKPTHTSPADPHWIAACDVVWIMWPSRRLLHFFCTRPTVRHSCDVASLSGPLWSDTLLLYPSPVALPKVDLFYCTVSVSVVDPSFQSTKELKTESLACSLRLPKIN